MGNEYGVRRARGYRSNGGKVMGRNRHGKKKERVGTRRVDKVGEGGTGRGKRRVEREEEG